MGMKRYLQANITILNYHYHYYIFFKKKVVEANIHRTSHHIYKMEIVFNTHIVLWKLLNI